MIKVKSLAINQIQTERHAGDGAVVNDITVGFGSYASPRRHPGNRGATQSSKIAWPIQLRGGSSMDERFGKLPHSAESE